MSDKQLKKLKKSDWYKERPVVIQQAINLLTPTQMWKLKNSGKQCMIYSYEEPVSGKLEDVTVTVTLTGRGGVMDSMGLGMLDTYKVSGIKFNDLEPWE